MKKLLLCLALVGCHALSAADVAKDALKAADILCILSTGLTDSAAVAEACKIDKTFAPLIEQLLADAQKAHVGRLPAGK